MPTSALGATATVAPEASRSTMSRRRNAVRPCVVALELRAADLRRDSGCRNSARSPRSATASHRSSMIGPLASRHHTRAAASQHHGDDGDGGDRSPAHHRMPAVEHEPRIERQPPAGLPQPTRRAIQPRRGAVFAASRVRERAGCPPGCAGAHPAPLPVPGAPRCADCYPCPSCPIGRPLVRRLSTGPVTWHALPANRFRMAPQRISHRTPPGRHKPPAPMPNSD